MYHKRLLLLGITIIGSGWIYPNQAENSITQKDGSTHFSAGDTTEKAGGLINAVRSHLKVVTAECLGV